MRGVYPSWDLLQSFEYQEHQQHQANSWNIDRTCMQQRGPSNVQRQRGQATAPKAASQQPPPQLTRYDKVSSQDQVRQPSSYCFASASYGGILGSSGLISLHRFSAAFNTSVAKSSTKGCWWTVPFCRFCKVVAVACSRISRVRGYAVVRVPRAQT